MLSADKIVWVCSSILEAAGGSREDSRSVAESLTESNLMGHDSHGVIRIPSYVDMIQRGFMNPKADISVIRETPTTALIDGNWGFGQVTAKKGLKISIKKARENRLSHVGIFHCTHIGRLGEYSQLAAEEGFISIISCNSGKTGGGGGVSPFGGAEALLGTNPVSIAFPAAESKPFVLDIATSVVSQGKIKVAKDKGDPIPEGWVADKYGNSTTNPNDLYDGGFLLPFGGYQGYGLSLFIEVMGGILSGARCAALPDYKGGNGINMLLLDIEAFRPLAEFSENVDILFNRVKNSKLAPGCGEILIPGEPEFRIKEERVKKGVIIPDKTWKDILAVASKYGLDLDEATA